MLSNRLKHLFYCAAVWLLVPHLVLASTSQTSGKPIKLTFLGVSVKERAERAINFLLGIAGGIALLILVVGGVMMIASAGNLDAREKAKKTLVGGITGLILVLLSFIFVWFTDYFLAK